MVSSHQKKELSCEVIVMGIDTLWDIAVWTLGAAVASPFIIFGLLLAACAFFIALDIIGVFVPSSGDLFFMAF